MFLGHRSTLIASITRERTRWNLSLTSKCSHLRRPEHVIISILEYCRHSVLQCYLYQYSLQSTGRNVRTHGPRVQFAPDTTSGTDDRSGEEAVQGTNIFWRYWMNGGSRPTKPNPFRQRYEYYGKGKIRSCVVVLEAIVPTLVVTEPATYIVRYLIRLALGVYGRKLIRLREIYA